MRYREPRHPTELGVRVAFGDEVYWAALVNVSETGAKLALSKQLPKDVLVTITHLTNTLSARVAWSNAGQTGIQFSMPLPSSTLAGLQSLVRR